MTCGFLTGRRKKKPEYIESCTIKCIDPDDIRYETMELFMGKIKNIPKGWVYVEIIERCPKSKDGHHLPSDLWMCCHCGENCAPKEIRESMSRAWSRWYY